MIEEQEDYQETRVRTKTAKGRGFQIQLMKDQSTSAQRAWRKQLNKVEILLINANDAAPLLSERNLLETKMEILVLADERLDEALKRTTKQSA